MLADGVELVSRVIGATWQSEIIVVRETLPSHFDIKFNRACGTHVHIKPKDRTYTTPNDVGTVTACERLHEVLSVFVKRHDTEDTLLIVVYHGVVHKMDNRCIWLSVKSFLFKPEKPRLIWKQGQYGARKPCNRLVSSARDDSGPCPRRYAVYFRLLLQTWHSL